MAASKHDNVSTEPKPDVPDYLAGRNAIFEILKQKQDAIAVQQVQQEIEIRFVRGENKPTRTLAGISWKTTPALVAKQVSVRSEQDLWIVALVDGQPWDMERLLERSCTLQLLDFDHPEGKKAFWNSSAHVLGNAIEQRFQCLLNEGLARHDGFIQEFGMPGKPEPTNGTGTTTKATTIAITKADYKPLHRIVHKIINKELPFERLQVSKQDLIAIFPYNKYKLHAIEQLKDGDTAVVYRCGDHIDLCHGPLISHTGRIKAFELVKNSSSYFLGNASNDSLQRIHGISFPNKKVGLKFFDIQRKWLQKLRKAKVSFIGLRGTQTMAEASVTA